MNPSRRSVNEVTEWAELWRERLVTGICPAETPEGVLVLGQPGTGKATVVEELRHYYGAKGHCVVLNPEELVLAHPHLEHAPETNPLETPHCPRRQAVEVAQGALETAMAQRLHTVLRNMVHEPLETCRLVDRLKQHGYHVCVIVLVVPPEDSRSDSRTVQQELRDYLCVEGELDTKDHDVAVSRLPLIVDALEKQGLADEIHLVTRQGKCLASSTDPQHSTPGALAEILGHALTSQDAVPPAPPDQTEKTLPVNNRREDQPTSSDSAIYGERGSPAGAPEAKVIELSDGRRMRLGRVKPTPEGGKEDTPRDRPPAKPAGERAPRGFRINIKPEPLKQPVEEQPQSRGSNDALPVTASEGRGRAVSLPEARREEPVPPKTAPRSSSADTGPDRAERLPDAADDIAPRVAESGETASDTAPRDFALRYQQLTETDRKQVDRRLRLQEKLRRAAQGGYDNG